MKMKTNLNLTKIILTMMIGLSLVNLGGCTSATEETTPDVPTLQGEPYKSKSRGAHIDTISGNEEEETAEIHYNTVFDIDIAVPANYTSHAISVNSLNAIEYTSTADDSVITLIPSEFSTTIENESIATSLAEWFVQRYSDGHTEKSRGVATADGGYYRNQITFDDGYEILYLVKGNRTFAILGNETNSDINTIANSITHPAKATTVTEKLPTNYLTLTGGAYYSMKDIGEDGSYIIFPLTTTKTTLQVFGGDSAILYDTYLLRDSSKLANRVTLKLKSGNILYVSSDIGISKKS